MCAEQPDMTISDDVRPDLSRVLGGLKDFQRDTVEYVFRRLYTDRDAVSRFLIADEVGLGKTLVARGVIARAIHHLWDTVERVNVVYICSNQAIARQNIDRLNITEDRHFQYASRATLLPVEIESMRRNRLNLVSLTPGTSLDLRSTNGRYEERILLYHLLLRHWRATPGRLSNVLRCSVGRQNWAYQRDRFGDQQMARVDAGLVDAFYTALGGHPELLERYEDVARLIGGKRVRFTDEMRTRRNALVGDLRALLARSSLRALQPQLVIMDEFQRFKHLLADHDETAALAREVFSFPEVKVLLLSATPYRWYTLDGEGGVHSEEGHYADFCATVNFLLRDDPEAAGGLAREIGRYHQAMLRLEPGAPQELLDAKRTVEGHLRRVMVRTERLAASVDRNGMLAESRVAQDLVRETDLAAYVHLDRIACALEAGDQIEYWKSSAYPLNLMDGYVLKQKFAAGCKGERRIELSRLLEAARASLLGWQTIEDYGELDLGNARLRALAQESLDTGNWRLLWMPASLPYYAPGGPFAGVAPAGATKSLVFSAWRLVPKAIALLLSYEAERRMLEGEDRDYTYSQLTQRRRPLLTFALSQERLTGMPIFCLTYPCLALATSVDPLTIACALGDGPIPGSGDVWDVALEQVTIFAPSLTARRTSQRKGAPIRTGTGSRPPFSIARRVMRGSRPGWMAIARRGKGCSTMSHPMVIVRARRGRPCAMPSMCARSGAERTIQGSVVQNRMTCFVC